MSATSNAAIAEAQADFGLNLLRDTATANNKASIVLSPLSVAVALSMAYAGAKNETEAELGRLLANGQPKEKIHEYFGSLVQLIGSSDKNYTLETANRIYVKQGLQLLDAYKKILDEHYQGQFESVDFGKNAETAQIINDFVANATHDKIHDLIDAGSLGEMTRLILINAIYFKGSWEKKFDPKRTNSQTFYVAEGNEKEVEMMHKTSSYIYQEDEEKQVLGLPYQDSEVLMFVVLPKERYGLENVLTNLTGSQLLELVKNRNKREVMVSLPKFKIESKHALTSILQKAGLQNAMSSSADFSGISGAGGLQISDVIQKAFIETNEEGTEAAAATGVQVRMMSAGPRNPEFNADHSFLYAIVTQSGEVLFNGVVRENH